MTGRFPRPAALSLAVVLAVALAAGLASPSPSAAGILQVAVADSYNVAHDQTRTVAAPGVLANDLQLGGAFTAQLVTDVAHGSLDLDPDGGFRYDPDSGYAGTDTFRYRVNGGPLGLSNTATVTLTIAAGPTPTPTPHPTPTATPTATPRPTPTPTPTATPTATPRPTPTPTPGPSGVPTLPPIPTLPTLITPLPSLGPTPTPGTSPTARPTATPAADPERTPAASQRTAADVAGGGPVASSGTGADGGPTDGAPTIDQGPFIVPVVDRGPVVELDAGDLTFGGFEWAVPALVLSVPGLLLILAVILEALIGLAWLPVARRWVGEEERSRARPRRRLTPS